MDAQTMIGFWIILVSGIPAAISCAVEAAGDQRLRDEVAILKGPSLLVHGNIHMRFFPKIRQMKTGRSEATRLLHDEVRQWCKDTNVQMPRFCTGKRLETYAVFKNPNDAFAFKLRWL